MTNAATAPEGVAGGALIGDAVRLPNATGLHARPAAMLVALAKKYQSTLRLVRGEDEANAKSVVSIMALGTRQGDILRVKAMGADAAEAIGAVSALLVAGCGELHEEAPVAVAMAASPAETVRVAAPSVNALSGVCASPGLAVGRIVQYRQDVIVVAETDESPEREHGKLVAALKAAQDQIEALKNGVADPAGAAILDAHQHLLQDPDLLEIAVAGVMQSQAAGHAWRLAFMQYAQRLECLEGAHNALLRERGSDIRDVGRRVLALLAGVKPSHIDLPHGAILIAEELTPSDTASLDRSKLLGFCTTTGGATSHVAILARSFGIPALCGVDEAALALAQGTLVILDGAQGLLHHAPSESDIAQAHERMAQQAARREQEAALALDAAVTTDGHRIEVVANVRNATEAREAVALGGEGVGLLRSEFLFDERDTAPSEDEQAAAYVAVADALGAQRTLVIRTLDVGGDKPLPYLPLPKEDNPFLGLRGVRVSLDQPEMFRTQLRAILRASGKARLHIMFPMIATLEELREAKALLAAEAAASGHSDFKVGIMIEVPSAALLAEQFARETDFFSIGTNDLTQYTLAMDRGHPKLAKKADGLHPSVLKMIALTCEGAARHGKWVGVCGSLASDAMAVPVLIGLGVSELSVSVPATPAIKALVRRLSLNDCKVLAQEVIQLGTTAEVRARLAAFAP